MKRTRRQRDIRTAYLLLSPAVLLLLTVLAYPLGWEVWTSFTNRSPLQDGVTAFVGLENYRQQFDDNRVTIRCHLPRHLLHHIQGPDVHIRFLNGQD